MSRAPAVDEAPSAARDAISTHQLTKVYGSLAAVDGLDLSVPEGSTYAIVGPNGAGKTTTFQILASLLAPSAGSARVCGFDPVTQAADVRRRLGFMPDFFGVYDDVRVDEYLDFFAAAYRLPAARRKSVVADLLELVDLTHKKDAWVESLSRGMKQRLGLARALVHDPEVLILDEPASGLDPRARVEFRELVLELRGLGKTVLISSHILSELEEVATHVGILEAGRLLTQGSPAEILKEMRHVGTWRARLADPSQQELAASVLSGLTGVGGLNWQDGAVEFAVAGGEDAAPEVLEALVGAGVRVAEFTGTRAGLEELFMSVTKGVVR